MNAIILVCVGVSLVDFHIQSTCITFILDLIQHIVVCASNMKYVTI